MMRERTKNTEMKWQIKPNGISLQNLEISDGQGERKDPLLLILMKESRKTSKVCVEK